MLGGEAQVGRELLADREQAAHCGGVVAAVALVLVEVERERP
jgi:hypothetical protein